MKNGSQAARPGASSAHALPRVTRRPRARRSWCRRSPRRSRPNRVYVGAYLTDVSDFDLKAGRFKADLRVWLKWLGTDDVPNLTFENGEIDSKDELGKEHDGAWHSVQYRVQGTFRGEFPVHDFPFDRQKLPVVFGLEQAGGQLVPDLGASGMSPRFSITGWIYEPYFNARAETKTFGSDLGSVVEEGKSTVLPRVAFTVELRRPIAPYMLKFVLPLALILLMALLALFLPAEALEVRSAMGVTSLLVLHRLPLLAVRHAAQRELPRRGRPALPGRVHLRHRHAAHLRGDVPAAPGAGHARPPRRPRRHRGGCRR